MLPPEDDPENKRRREIVRINLPPRPFAETSIHVPLLPGAPIAISKKTHTTWPVAVLSMLAIWAFIGAVVTMILYSVFSDNFNWDVSRSADVLLFLFVLWVIMRCPKICPVRK